MRESSNTGCTAAFKRTHEGPGAEMGGLWDSIKQTSQVSRVPKLPTPTGSVGTKRVKLMVHPTQDSGTVSTSHLVFSVTVERSAHEDIPHHLSIQNVPSVGPIISLARG
jgi:hypothetical protein